MGSKGRQPKLDASDLKFGIVVARYNREVSERLLDGALQLLSEQGAPEPQVEWVPGALEIPLAAELFAAEGAVDGVICLGCVIQGETAHFQLVAEQCVAGVANVQLRHTLPCAFGVLTTYNLEQALARSGGSDNKGREAAATAVEMVRLVRRMRALPGA